MWGSSGGMRGIIVLLMMVVVLVRLVMMLVVGKIASIFHMIHERVLLQGIQSTLG